MKKRILVFCMLAISIMCLFAITASAAETIGGIVYDLNANNKTASVTEANKTSTIENVVIPDTVVGADGNTYTVVSVNNSAFSTNTTIKSVSLPKGLTYLGKYAFAQCPNLVSATFNGTSLTQTGTGIFERCQSLTGIVLPEGLETLGNCAFNGCSSLASVTFPSTLKKLDDNSHFKDTALTSIIGLENTKLEAIPHSAFRGVRSFKGVIKLPNTVKTLATYSFADVQMTSVTLGASVTQIDSEAFTGCGSLKNVYVPGTITTIQTNSFNGKGVYFFVTSTDATYLGTIKAAVNTSNDVVSYADYSKSPSSYKNGKYVISGYNACDAFYNGVHQEEVEDNNPCWLTDCKNCGETGLYVGNESTHNYKYKASYTNYFANGNKLGICQNANCECGKEYEVVDTVAPIISRIKGYATSDDGKEITFGYDIDTDALAYYNELAGSALELGFVVAVNAYLDGAPLNSNGTEAELAKGKVVKTVTNAVYSSVDFRLTGKWNDNVTIGDEETQLKYVELFIAGYIFDGTVNYVNEGGSSTDYTTVTAVTHTPKPVA